MLIGAGRHSERESGGYLSVLKKPCTLRLSLFFFQLSFSLWFRSPQRHTKVKKGEKKASEVRERTISNSNIRTTTSRPSSLTLRPFSEFKKGETHAKHSSKELLSLHSGSEESETCVLAALLDLLEKSTMFVLEEVWICTTRKERKKRKLKIKCTWRPQKASRTNFLYLLRYP